MASRHDEATMEEEEIKSDQVSSNQSVRPKKRPDPARSKQSGIKNWSWAASQEATSPQPSRLTRRSRCSRVRDSPAPIWRLWGVVCLWGRQDCLLVGVIGGQTGSRRKMKRGKICLLRRRGEASGISVAVGTRGVEDRFPGTFRVESLGKRKGQAG